MLGFEQAGFEQAPDLDAGMAGIAALHDTLTDQAFENGDPVAGAAFAWRFR